MAACEAVLSGLLGTCHDQRIPPRTWLYVQVVPIEGAVVSTALFASFHFPRQRQACSPNPLRLDFPSATLLEFLTFQPLQGELVKGRESELLTFVFPSQH